ncbi:MAG: cystathionine gamma-synthase [Xanthomonadales bacterium]|nr:cystathionine gamma-synthase [Xanthomonadales bacterium]
MNAAYPDRIDPPPRSLETTTRETIAVRSALESDTQHGAVVPPLHLSSTFAFEGFGQKRTYDYTRSGNPSRDALAEALAASEGGAGASVVASGMAAVTLVCQLLKPDDLVVVPHDCYGGCYRLFTHLAGRGLFNLAVVDQNDEAALADALAREPRLVWIETPSNPLLRLVDIERVAARARQAGALVVVDNTFLSPAGQSPLALGADLVVHSTTKYINGHSDVVGGAVIAADAGLAEELAWWANCLGLTGAPFDAWLTLRGLRTLHPRIAQHNANAQAVAEFLKVQDAVQAVHYPGLASHPHYDLARRQQRIAGGMVSFELAGGEAAVARFVAGLSCFSLAESLGGVESLIAHPATMTHAAMDPEARAVAGISDGLLRLSVGIEAVEDLLQDLGEALDRATQVGQAVA